jgi:hypothetical protein
MNTRYIKVILCGICLLSATAALADSFSDVPANDPAYKLLAQLGEAGWRDQMGSPRRAMLLTRYEFGLEVSKVANRVTAQAEKDVSSLRPKSEALRALRSLIAQFRPELEKLGIDIATAQKTIDEALKTEPPISDGMESEDPATPRTVSPPSSPNLPAASSRFGNLPPIALNSEMEPWTKDLMGFTSRPLVMTSIGAGLLALDHTTFRDVWSQEPQRLTTTEFKLPVTDNLRISASLAELRSLARDSSQKAWSAEAEYALGRWKLDASLRFAGSDHLASALIGIPRAHSASAWRSMGGGVTYAPKEWLTLFARVSGVTDLSRLQNNYIISSGGVGISLKDRLALEVNWLHLNPFDPAQSSSLLTRLGLKASLSPSTQWHLFYQMDNTTTTSTPRSNIIGAQVSVKF